MNIITLAFCIQSCIYFSAIVHVDGHPQCLDFRPPFQLMNKLTFCTEYESFGCCTNDMDSEIEMEFDESVMDITRVLGRSPSLECLESFKSIFCQRCSPYAAHIFDAEETGFPRPMLQPGLCMTYCSELYQKCFSDDLLTLVGLSLEDDVDEVTFCRAFEIPDEDYCYPELLSNPVLNGDIEQEVITQDGCLCLEPFATNLRNPLNFDVPLDDTKRIFIGEQVGVVLIYFEDGTRLEEPFLDIADQVLSSSSSGDERGFLGFTFHPDFRNNQRFFVFFSIYSGFSQATRISEFRVSSSNPNRADHGSEKILLEINQPYSNHNGGELLFGTDGYLYIFSGDGGAGGDPQNFAQNKGVHLGKVLRIDVDSQPDEGLSYKVPDDNPFVDDPDFRPEIYAYGIRNIWRCDVDEGDPVTGANRGRIICGDVGQSNYEEIDVIVSGGNYGWNSREGFECYRGRCKEIGPEVLPIYAYSHSVGKSVTGGATYRGCMSPNLNGKYFYGDFVVGKIWTLEETTNGWVNNEVTMCGSDTCFNGLVSRYDRHVLAFGEDADGEVYVLTTDNASSERYAGNVFKIVDPRRRGDRSTCRTYRTDEGGNEVSRTPSVQTTTTPTTAPNTDCSRLDLAFALDTSGSVGETNWQKKLDFLMDFLDMFTVSSECTRVALLSFGNSGYLYSALDEFTSRDGKYSVIRQMLFRDHWTNTGAGLALLTSDIYVPPGDRLDAPNVAIFITDGPSNRDTETTIPNAERARAQNIDIITIGIGSEVDTTELQSIVGEEGRNVYINNYDELQRTTFMQELLNNINDVADIEDGDGTDRSTDLTSSTTDRATTTTATTTTTTTTPRITVSTTTTTSAPSDGCGKIDLTFALDSSGSVTQTNWNKMLNFVIDTLERMSISMACTRVSLMSFGTDGYMYSRLNEHTARQDKYDVVRQMPFQDEWTNMGAAFALMVSDVYVPANGDRSDADNIAVLIADGPSNRNRDQTVPNAMSARGQGIELITIGVGPSVDSLEMLSITDDASRNIYIDSFDDMSDDAFQQLIVNKLNEIGNVPIDGGSREEDDISSTMSTSTSTSTPTSTTARPGDNDDGSSSFAWTCSFEDDNGNPTWCDTTQDTTDQFDWTMGSGNTPSDPTGPSNARSGAHYVFIEATGRQSMDQARLRLPRVPSTGTYCLTFSYHMYGWHIDTLLINKETPGGSQSFIWSDSKEKGNFWIDASATVSLNQNENLIFIGQRGDEYSGDIGLDSIDLVSGNC